MANQPKTLTADAGRMTRSVRVPNGHDSHSGSLTFGRLMHDDPTYSDVEKEQDYLDREDEHYEHPKE